MRELSEVCNTIGDLLGIGRHNAKEVMREVGERIAGGGRRNQRNMGRTKYGDSIEGSSTIIPAHHASKCPIRLSNFDDTPRHRLRTEIIATIIGDEETQKSARAMLTYIVVILFLRYIGPLQNCPSAFP